ncbi:MAG: beta-lactamase family protein [bacterium]|nr:beta-lactamase family protein [bacterium]
MPRLDFFENTALRLLRRAIGCGLFGGAVAAIGVGNHELEIVVAGSSRLFPRRLPVTQETWFDLASLTKPLVGTSLTLLARREGRIDLQAPICCYLSEAKGTRIGEARIVDLLCHTAGLPAWKPTYCFAQGRPHKIIDTLVSFDLDTARGQDVVYSCLGFLILGQILERVFENSLDEAFAERVVQPLGLEDLIGFRPRPERHAIAGGSLQPTVERELVKDLGLDPWFIPDSADHLPDDGNSRFLGGVAANSGLFGSVLGVSRLAQQYLPTMSTLLTAEEIRLATQNWTPGMAQERGLGWQLNTTKGCSGGASLSGSAFGHTGFTGPSLWIDPSREVIMLILTHRHHPNHRGVDLHPLRRRFHALVEESAYS